MLVINSLIGSNAIIVSIIFIFQLILIKQIEKTHIYEYKKRYNKCVGTVSIKNIQYDTECAKHGSNKKPKANPKIE